MVEPTASCGFGPAGQVGLPLIVSAITVISKLAVPVPPAPSVAVHVMVCVPTTKLPPYVPGVVASEPPGVACGTDWSDVQ